MPDAHPLEDIHVSLENWISFVREGGSDDFFNAGSTRSIGEQSRVNAVAGNYSQGSVAVACAKQSEFEIDRRLHTSASTNR